jgi:S1-C subfamily serine protease
VGREEPATRSASDERIAREIGLVVRELTLLQTAQIGRGVVVTEVISDSQSERKGLRPGDVVLSVNSFETNAPGDFYARLFASAAVQDTTIRLQRGREVRDFKFRQIERVSE